VDGTASGLYLKADFGISRVELSASVILLVT
jgi:hypothetical protein